MATTHVVRQGECLASIAKRYGFADWRTVYQHGANAELRRRRPNPHAIFPGDKVVIPDKDQKVVECATTARHTFKAKQLKVLLKIVVKDEEERPLAGKRYALALEGQTLRGSTDGSGMLEQKVSTTVESGELTVWKTGDEEGERYVWTIKVGHLDPVEEIVGAQQRLNNLGYYCGEPSGRLDRVTRAAIKAFQMAQEITASGELDDATRAKLTEAHGNQ